MSDYEMIINMDNQFPNKAVPSKPVHVRVILPSVEPIITYVLLAINVIIYLYFTSLSDVGKNLFYLDWAKFNEAVNAGEYYRLFTSMFVHFEFFHIFLNGYALYYFGREVERLYGYFRFTIIYILGGLAGSVGSYMYTDAPSIGASGAVFAIFSALGVYFYHHRHLYGKGADRRIVQMAFLGAFNIFFGFVQPRIDNAAHIGGILGGILLAWFICPELKITGIDAQYGELPEPKVVDANELKDWIIVPIVFAISLAILVVLLTSQTSS